MGYLYYAIGLRLVRIMHITEARNLPSILKKGLLPHKPRLRNHRRTFRKAGVKSKIIYTWGTDNNRRMAKLAKDVAYWHVWGWRNNGVIDALFKREPKFTSAKQIKLLKQMRPAPVDTTFVALLADIPNSWLKKCYNHKQLGREQPQYQLLDLAREHIEPMYLIERVIPPRTIRVWATMWTMSEWTSGEGWDTRAFLRRTA